MFYGNINSWFFPEQVAGWSDPVLQEMLIQVCIIFIEEVSK